MFLRVFVSVVAGILFLFFFWKKLREDYTHFQIFTAGFYSIGVGALATIISAYFFPEWWFWSGFLGGLVGLFAGIIRFRLRFFETLEAFVYGALFVIASIFAYDWVIAASYISGFALMVLVSVIVIFRLLDQHYKRFTWYKSGRVGFTGLSVMGIVFLIRAVVAAMFPGVLSFVGNTETILSGIVSFLAFLAVFNLSRQT